MNATEGTKLLVWILAILVFGNDAHAKPWNGIVPCVSTRLDAEKILGRDDPPSNIGIYEYRNSRVHIEYNENNNGDSGKDIVRNIEVYPDETILLRAYIVKISNFQRDFLKTTLDDKKTHVPGRAVYRSWSDGFEIWVQKNASGVKVIESFGYFDKAYSCSKILPR